MLFWRLMKDLGLMTRILSNGMKTECSTNCSDTCRPYKHEQINITLIKRPAFSAGLPPVKNAISALCITVASSSHAQVLVPSDNGLVLYENALGRVLFKAPPTPKYSEPKQPTKRLAAPRISVKSAPPAIENAMREVAFSAARNRAVVRAGLSSREFHALFRANIQIESGFNPNAVSKVGAIGLGQLMPETARDLGVNPHNPRENLEGSARYLVQMLDLFGSKELALAAYNAGPAAVQKFGGIPPYKETQNHVRKVVSLFNQILRS